MVHSFSLSTLKEHYYLNMSMQYAAILKAAKILGFFIFAQNTQPNEKSASIISYFNHYINHQANIKYLERRL